MNTIGTRLMRLYVVAPLVFGFFRAFGARAASADEVVPLENNSCWSIKPVDDSGVDGIVTFADNGDETTTVAIELQGGITSSSLSSELREGTIERLSPTPGGALNDVVDGKSTTQSTIPLETIQAEEYVLLIADEQGVVAFGNKWAHE